MAEIAPTVRAFIAEHITSVAQLELILLLRLAPDRWWSVDSLIKETRTEAAWTANVLKDLCARGICEQSAESPEQFRFRPRTPEIDQAVAALAQDYLVNRLSIIELIYTRPGGPLRSFSDAFDLRKRKTDG